MILSKISGHALEADKNIINKTFHNCLKVLNFFNAIHKEIYVIGKEWNQHSIDYLGIVYNTLYLYTMPRYSTNYLAILLGILKNAHNTYFAGNKRLLSLFI